MHPAVSNPFRASALLSTVLAGSLFVSRAADPPLNLPSPVNRSIDFTKDIQPILEKSCFECHAGTKAKGELQLDTREHALKGGESGPAIIPGKSADSLLVQAVAGVDPDLIMPKKGDRLSTEQIALLRTWIDQGANWPATAKADKRNHWAFKAPVRPSLAVGSDKKWARNPIDSFVLARLEKENLRPSPEAERRALIRRVTLDLTGLVPTPAEVDTFLADAAPGAYERV